MYGFLFENHLYRVALEECDVNTLYNQTIAKLDMIVDLQTRTFVKFQGEAQSITTSNPFYGILMNLPLMTFNELQIREPRLFL